MTMISAHTLPKNASTYTISPRTVHGRSPAASATYGDSRVNIQGVQSLPASTAQRRCGLGSLRACSSFVERPQDTGERLIGSAATLSAEWIRSLDDELIDPGGIVPMVTTLPRNDLEELMPRMVAHEPVL